MLQQISLCRVQILKPNWNSRSVLVKPMLQVQSKREKLDGLAPRLESDCHREENKLRAFMLQFMFSTLHTEIGFCNGLPVLLI